MPKLWRNGFYFKGTPTLKPDAVAEKGQEIAAMLTTNIALESQAIKMYNEAAITCARKKTKFPNNCSRSSSAKKKTTSTSLKIPKNISLNWVPYT